MKANRPPRSLPLLCAAVGLAALSGCVEAPRPPAPAPRPAPPPPPPPSAAPTSSDWRDVPATPGDWTWTRDGRGSVAQFAGGVFVVRCTAQGGLLRLERAGSAAGTLPMTVTTTTVVRPLNAAPLADAPGFVGASLTPGDPLLDAMAFSRGRIAIEAAGMAPLYIPVEPEMARAIEDCR